MSRNLGFAFGSFVKEAKLYTLSDPKTFDGRWPLSPGAYVLNLLDAADKTMGAAKIVLFDKSGNFMGNTGGGAGEPLTLDAVKQELGKDSNLDQPGKQGVAKFYLVPAPAFVFSSAAMLLNATTGEAGKGPVPYGAYNVTVTEAGKAVQEPQVFVVSDAGVLPQKGGGEAQPDPWGAYNKAVQDLYAKFPQAVVTLIPVGAGINPPIVIDPKAKSEMSPLVVVGVALGLLWLLTRKKSASAA